MNAQCGSYQYDSFDKAFQRQEFERLYHQASTFLETERQLWPSLNIVSGKRVLDVGCGSGVISHELSKQVYPGDVVGVDVSQTLLDKGSAFYSTHAQQQSRQAEQAHISFQQGSVYDLPFADNSFDIVYARLLFQHLENPIQALENILSVLKPGGMLCVLDVDKDWSSLYPEPESSPLLDQAIIEKQLSNGGDPWVGRKLSYYLKSSGFSQVKTTITLVDSDRIGLENFFEMLTFGRSSAVADAQFSALQKQAQLDIKSLIKNPCAWAGFGLFVVTGKKDAFNLNY